MVLHRLGSALWAIVLCQLSLHQAQGNFLTHPWEFQNRLDEKSDLRLQLLNGQNLLKTNRFHHLLGKNWELGLSGTAPIGSGTGVFGSFRFLSLSWEHVLPSQSGLSDHSFGLYRELTTQSKLSLYWQIQTDWSFTSLTRKRGDLTGGVLARLPVYRLSASTLLFETGVAISKRIFFSHSQLPSSFFFAPWSISLSYVPKDQGFLASLLRSGILPLHAPTWRFSLGYQVKNQLVFKASYLRGISHGLFAVPPELPPHCYLRQLRFQSMAFEIQISMSPPALREKLPPPKDPSNANFILEAKILKTNDRLNLVKIDKGREDGVELGQIFDIFEDHSSGGRTIARGKVLSVRPKESALELTDFYENLPIEEDFIVRSVSPKPTA